jgi:hypothetical protein
MKLLVAHGYPGSVRSLSEGQDGAVSSRAGTDHGPGVFGPRHRCDVVGQTAERSDLGHELRTPVADTETSPIVTMRRIGGVACCCLDVAGRVGSKCVGGHNRCRRAGDLAHGGRVEAASEGRGTGATFVLSLPTARS